MRNLSAVFASWRSAEDFIHLNGGYSAIEVIHGRSTFLLAPLRAWGVEAQRESV